MNNDLNATVVAFRDRVAVPALPAVGSVGTTGGFAAGGTAPQTKRSTLGKPSPHPGSA
ncbi:hypothetical protein [Cumulibacter manganitolerans]|uniref:hypothetical protein n=1 Tax=Cumulibacter manganitolerans TaxID=1884992 RepID=UPI0012975E68|nr:hypothetical protein [Cumulibacter manganitolerans]